VLQVHDILPDVIRSASNASGCRAFAAFQNNGKTRHIQAVCDMDGIGTFVDEPELLGKLSQGVTIRPWLIFV